MVAVGIVSSTGLLIASARAEDAGPRSGSPRAAAAALSAHGTRPRTPARRRDRRGVACRCRRCHCRRD